MKILLPILSVGISLASGCTLYGEQQSAVPAVPGNRSGDMEGRISIS